MRDMIKLVSGRAITAGITLVGVSLILQHIDTGLPNCISAAGFAAGSVLLIFMLGRSVGCTHEENEDLTVRKPSR